MSEKICRTRYLENFNKMRTLMESTLSVRMHKQFDHFSLYSVQGICHFDSKSIR